MAGLGAAAGGQVGYALGRRAGDALHDRPDGRIYKRRYLERTHEYFERYGAETILIARFMPFIRTLSSPAAGIAEMSVRRFSVYNIASAAIWAVVVATIGYVLGGVLDVERHALPITLGHHRVLVHPGRNRVCPPPAAGGLACNCGDCPWSCVRRRSRRRRSASNASM